MATNREYEKLALVRHVEQHQIAPWYEGIQQTAASVEADLAPQPLSFRKKALSRSASLVALTGLWAAYQRFTLKSRSIALLIYGLMALLGFVALMQTLAGDSAQINVYWLLLCLLGLNTFSMTLWLLFAFTSSATSSPLTVAYKAMLSGITKRSSNALFFNAWSEFHFQGKQGKWHISRILHSAWLVYLLAGGIALLLLLSGKQYDYVWGTTILSSGVFVDLTQALATLPRAIGLTLPDAELVLASQQGSNAILPEGARMQWSSFMLSSLALYGVLPRLLLIVISSLCLKRAQNKHQPNWEMPYFYSLRSRLLPQSSALGVVDADLDPSNAVGELSYTSISNLPLIDEAELPAKAYSAAFEWGQSSVPVPPIKIELDFAKVDDVHSQTGMLEVLRQSSLPVVILVDLQRAADRGAARFFKEVAECVPLYLLVVQRAPQSNDAARWAAWQALCERIALPEGRAQLVRAT